jgi:IS5 family transposase
VTGGEAHEVKGYEALIELHDVAPDRLLGDKGYDSDAIRDDLTKRGIEPVIPPRSNRKTRSNTITKPTSGAISLSDVSTVSSSFAVLQRVTKKPPEPTFQCYASQPQGSG